MRIARKLGLALALSMAMTQADAVDVDRIEIRSRLGEPLHAEIPITGATPAELGQVRAQLASATTFARIGLPRPQGVVADLAFEVVRGPRPVIRITSQAPVQEEFLTFLVQVDAPQGRLVREFSIALGASPSLPAAAPPIQAPAAAGANGIAREADPANALPAPVAPALQMPDTAPPVPVAEPPPPPVPLHGDRAAPRAAAPRQATAPPPRATPGAAAAPVARRAASPAPAPRAPARAASRPPAPASGPGYTVRAGDNLTRLVARMGLDEASPQQAMLALLRTNPQAFASANINLLRTGAVLRAPAPAELARLDAATAEALVRQQIEQWRSGQLPPADAALAAVSPPAVASSAAPVSAPPAAAPAPARLEIAPAATGSPLGAAAGLDGTAGNSPAERERAAAEQLATRYTEMQQMQQRIAELEHAQKEQAQKEQAQKEQARLLALKDRQLGAHGPQSAGVWPWIVAALSLAVAAFALLRRRPRRPGKVATRIATLTAPREAQPERAAVS